MTYNYSRLIDILSTCRDGGSAGEKEIIRKHIETIDGIECDTYGNYYVQLGRPNGVMFACHTDTVHRPKDPVRQEIGFFSDSMLAVMEADKILGADDGAGIELMLTMIEHNVPGLYVFHRDEEIGGQGSSHIAKDPWMLEGITKCISFDRKGYDDVITHQGGMRCCSDMFANALAKDLNSKHVKLAFKPDDSGLFTDSANYTHLISECTNLSVGYFNQHTNKELLDVEFLDRMVKACINVNWAGLPAMRDPKAWEDSYKWGTYNMYGRLPDFKDWFEVYEWVNRHPEDAADYIYDQVVDVPVADATPAYNDDGISIEDPGSYTFED